MASTVHSPSPSVPPSPTKDDKNSSKPPQEGSIDFDNLMEKQRELLKHIRESPDKKKDKITALAAATAPTAPGVSSLQSQEEQQPEWGWSFERVPSSRNSSAAYDGAASASAAAPRRSSKKASKKQRRQQAEEWISDWHYERVNSQKQEEATAATAESSFDGGHDSQGTTSQWFFERIPSEGTAAASAVAGHGDDTDSVMEMIMDDKIDDDFAALEAAVVDVNPDDISLEDLVAHDDDDEDDVIMSVDGDEGLLPLNTSSSHGIDDGDHHHQPQYMQELKHRQYSAAYMDELKHRQAEGPAVPQGMYNQRQELPPPPSYTAELKTVTEPVKAEDDVAMDEDGDAEMGSQDDNMKTPDSSGHTPRLSHKTTRSPSCVMTETMDSSMTSSNGFPRPQNLGRTKSESYASSAQLPCAEGMDDLFKNTLDKLTQSMKRSAESRRSLSIKTEHTQEYERNLCVHQILQSVESSSRQVDSCLQWYRPQDGGAPVPMPTPTAAASAAAPVSSESA